MKYLSFFLLFALPLQQEEPPVKFSNPSFEDTPRANALPAGWQSFTPNSTPDIQPGAWGLPGQPYDGKTFIGLVSREDGTHEDLGQTLTAPLKAEACYTFSIFLAHNPKYVGYNQPLRLRVWGGSSRGGKDQLLDSSPLIDHAEWKEYKFRFTPAKDIKYITLEAFYGPGVLFKYKGNILLDKCSVIERCDRA